MSGHSKWSTIKRKKGAEDAKRAKIFTRIARDIAVAAKEGGGDESSNPRLKLAIAKAKSENMPKDNIERAIARGTGKLEGIELEEIAYEAYGHEGVAFIIEVLTDNKNRSLADIKRVLNRAGGSLASAGSVLWQFDQTSCFELPADGGLDFDRVFEVAAEAGADDVVSEDGVITVYAPRELFAAVQTALDNAGMTITEAALRWIAQNEVEVSIEKATQNMRMMTDLEDLDDVQAVASNLLITEEAMTAYETA